MPFTPSHAVVALPFIRTPLVPAAIAVGAMTPDLPLFLRGVGVSYSFTHTSANILWTALLAFGLFLIWRVLLRPAVAELTPTWIAGRLPAEWSISGWDAARRAAGAGERRRYPLLLAISILLGVISHIVWDMFTHEERWGTELVPGLTEQWGALQGFKWLQHGSSVVGLMILAIVAALWLRRRHVGAVTGRILPGWLRTTWWLSLPTLLILAVVFGYLAYGPFTAEFTPQHLAYRVLPPAAAGWGFLTLALCLLVGILRAARR